jgi:F0F1-type ATP synthase membrane subunit b/b'
MEQPTSLLIFKLLFLTVLALMFIVPPIMKAIKKRLVYIASQALTTGLNSLAGVKN